MMWRSRLFWQLFLSIAGAMGVVLVFACFVIRHYVEAAELESVQNFLAAHASLVRDDLQEATADRVADKVQRWNNLARPIPIRIALIGQDGSLLADPRDDSSEEHATTSRPEILEARGSDVGRSVRWSRATQGRRVFVALRVEPSNHPVAYVRVSVPYDAVESAVYGPRTWIWRVMVLAIVPVLPLAFWISRRMAAPLNQLREGADQIAAGNYGKKIFVEQENEIGQLGRAFNHMSERLESQFRQMDEDRQQLRTVLSSMVEGVVAIDTDQRVLFANDRASVLLEFASGLPEGRHLWELVRNRQLQETVRASLENTHFQQQEFPWTSNSNRSLTVQLSRLPGHPPRGAILVFNDTSEIKQLVRMRQEFVANVSHELKTPLAVIQACVETLIDWAKDDLNQRDLFLNRIASNSQRLHSLILDLLQLARIESATEAFEFENVDLRESIKMCIQRHRALTEQKKQSVKIEFQVSDVPSTAWADEEAIEQILDNLLTNAIKYTPEGGEIHVRCANEKEMVKLEVKDTGIGISEADLTRVFERFYCVDKARSRELGGTGLGLAIVKHLAFSMGGSVHAQSKLGQGSTFTVLLPITKPR